MGVRIGIEERIQKRRLRRALATRRDALLMRRNDVKLKLVALAAERKRVK